MIKSDLIKKISNKSEIFTEEDTESSINIILSLLTSSLADGNRVEVRNFGTFCVSKGKTSSLFSGIKISKRIFKQIKRRSFIVSLA